MANIRQLVTIIPFTLLLAVTPLAKATAITKSIYGPPVIAPVKTKTKKVKRIRHYRLSELRKSVAIKAVKVQQKVQWLAKIIQAEAGDQSFNAKLAVGDVVMNRVDSGVFPDSIRGVILQSGQFSTVSNGSFFSAIPTPSDWKVAKFALQGWDIVPQALYFFNPTLYAGGWMNGLANCVTHDQMLFCSGPS